MQTWFIKNLGDAMLASDKLTQIEQFILSKEQKSTRTKEMAIFLRHESEGCLHCQVKVYFSPKASMAAKAFNAMPCAKPSPIDLSILVGNEESWLIFFPEYNR